MEVIKRIDNLLLEKGRLTYDDGIEAYSWGNPKEIQKIKDNCSEILNAYKKAKMFLFRGINKEKRLDTLIKKKPRKRRKPLDTPKEVQKELDLVFLDKFGWKPRAQGVFATSDYSNAGEYAKSTPHIIFPFDGFEFLWSPKILDLYRDAVDSGDMSTLDNWLDSYDPDSGEGHWERGNKKVNVLDELPGWYDDYVSKEDFKKGIFKKKVILTDDGEMGDREEEWTWVPEVTLEEYKTKMIGFYVNLYKNTNLIQAIKSGNEVMIKCSNYYILPTEDEMFPEDIPELFD